MTRHARAMQAACLAVLAASCGGGGGGHTLTSATTTTTTATPGSNVQSVIVDAGPADNSLNMLFVSVTVCVPGSTTNCQTIDHVQVDTGSSGLRLLASVLSASLTLPLQHAADGNTLVQCTQFIDGYSWGPVASADLTMGGETAKDLPVQIIGSAAYPTVPADCSGTGPSEDTVATFGANGILGVGPFAQDCGTGCANSTEPGVYYSCTQTQCQPVIVPLASQVPNPVTAFTTDNNGVVIQLPAVAASGALTLTGSLIFGVDTESNNKSAGTVIGLDEYGDFTTQFLGQTLTQSFIDAGSNGYFFNDASLAPCASTSDFPTFYCPASTQSLSASLQGSSGATANASFVVSNPETVETGNPSFNVYPDLAGTSSTGDSFDWGLPFFYGRTVYTVVESRTTSAGTGPYVAF
ncbi:MAG: DUF3443 domain-containing protein [Steroidobacteraceae bacterium]